MSTLTPSRKKAKESAAIGARLRDAREAIGLSQAELGRRLGGRGQAAIAAYENARNVIPLALIPQICRELNVRMEWLLEGTDPRTAAEFESILAKRYSENTAKEEAYRALEAVRNVVQEYTQIDDQFSTALRISLSTLERRMREPEGVRVARLSDFVEEFVRIARDLLGPVLTREREQRLDRAFEKLERTRSTAQAPPTPQEKLERATKKLQQFEALRTRKAPRSSKRK